MFTRRAFLGIKRCEPLSDLQKEEPPGKESAHGPIPDGGSGEPERVLEQGESSRPLLKEIPLRGGSERIIAAKTKRNGGLLKG